MIIFIHGEDTFRSREKLQEIMASFRQKRDASGLNIVRLEGADFDINRFKQETMTQGFLSPRKMIIVENLITSQDKETCEATLEFIKKNLAGLDDSNVVVFWETGVGGDRKTKGCKLCDYLKKQKYVYEFAYLKGAKLENWIIKRVEARGGRIRKIGAQRLGNLVGPDTWRLSCEIDKLVAYKDGREITVENIDEFVQGRFEANIFTLTDAIAAKHLSRALQLLTRELENGANELYLLSMISRQYRILLQIRDLLDRGQSSSAKIAKDLKLHPFVVQKSMAPAKRYSIDDLKLIHSRLLETDRQLKSTSLSPELLLGLLIVS